MGKPIYPESQEQQAQDFVNKLSPASTLQQRMPWCKTCSKEKFDLKQGVLCGLTQAKPAFEGTCPDYEVSAEKVVHYEKELNAPNAFSEGADAPQGCLGLYLKLAIGGAGLEMGQYVLWSVGGFPLVFVVASALIFTGYYLLYRWRKVGFYFLVGGVLLNGIFMIYHLHFLGYFYLAGNLISFAIAAIFVRKKWHFFK